MPDMPNQYQGPVDPNNPHTWPIKGMPEVAHGMPGQRAGLIGDMLQKLLGWTNPQAADPGKNPNMQTREDILPDPGKPSITNRDLRDQYLTP